MDIKQILKDHAAWLRDGSGKRADLSGEDLGGAVLRRANLGGANLSRADLGGANLSGANLGGATIYDGWILLKPTTQPEA